MSGFSRKLARFACLQYFGSFLVLMGSMLVAVQIRLKLTQGKPLGSDYQAHSLKLYLLMALILAVVQSINAIWMRYRHLPGSLSPYRQFGVLLFSQAAFLGAAAFFFPNLSQLQLAYFEVVGIILGLVAIVWPGSLREARQAGTFTADLKRLWDNRSLLGLWLNYNIRSRYSQTILGILWIVLLPLSTSAVLTVAFTQFLRMKMDVPFIVFFLAALVPYGIFTQGVQNSTRTILGMMGLLNQVYFPREVLVLVTLGEALVDLLFTALTMLIVNALYGFWPNTLFIFLPISLAILIMFTLGLMFFVSCLSVLIRDIPQLVAVILQLAFYLTPIIYPIDNFPVRYRALILANPLAPVIQSFRDIIVYHREPDPVMLYYPAVIAGVLLYTGYAFFKSNEDRFADLI